MKKVFSILFLILVAYLVSSPKSLAKTLEGTVSNVHGFIGIKRDWDNVVAKVYPLSPAWRAGIRKGDLILSVNGNRKEYADGPIGVKVRVVILRKGTELSFDVDRAPMSTIRANAEFYYLYN